MLQGTSGVGLIQGFNTEDFSTRFAGEIHGFGCNGYVPKKMERRMDATIKYIMVAGKKARPDRARVAVPGCPLCARASTGVRTAPDASNQAQAAVLGSWPGRLHPGSPAL